MWDYRKILVLVLSLLVISICLSTASAATYTHKVDSKTYTKAIGADQIKIKGHTLYLKNKQLNKHGFNHNIDHIVCYYKNGDIRIYKINYKQWKINLNKNVVKVKVYYSGLNKVERDKLEDSNYIPEKITMKSKPSCGCHYSYKWHTKTFFNYCPKCHRFNCLKKNPKCVHEREFTCKYCDSDFCGTCGKEKFNWSHKYLLK